MGPFGCRAFGLGLLVFSLGFSAVESLEKARWLRIYHRKAVDRSHLRPPPQCGVTMHTYEVLEAARCLEFIWPGISGLVGCQGPVFEERCNRHFCMLEVEAVAVSNSPVQRFLSQVGRAGRAL